MVRPGFCKRDIIKPEVPEAGRIQASTAISMTDLAFVPAASTSSQNQQMKEKTIRIVHARWQDDCTIRRGRLFRTANKDVALITEWNGENPAAVYWPRYSHVERLVYNPATNEFFATEQSGAFRTRASAPSLTGPQFAVHEPSKTLMYLISKNACSTQIGTILHELGYQPNQASPTRAWTAAAYRHCHNVEDYDPERYEGYTHMAVYQDPVQRFVNLANYAWCILPSLLQPYVASCKTKSQMIDTVLLLIDMNRNNHPGPFEQHLEGQAWYYNHCPRIDVLVPIEHLSSYMRTKMDIEPWNCNVDERHELTRADLAEDQIREIFRVWDQDGNLERIYAGKFYKPQSVEK